MKTIYISLLCLFTLSLFSQKAIDPMANWTKRHRVTGEIIDGTPLFLCGNEFSIISLYKEKDVTYLIKTDIGADVVKKIKVEAKGKGLKRKWENIYYNKKNDKLYLLSSASDQKNKEYKFYIETIDQQNLIYNDDAKEIGYIMFENEKKDLLGNVNILSSPSGERVLLSYAIVNNRRISKHVIHILDGNMNILSTREDKFPYIDGDAVFVDSYEIDDNGNIYVMQNRSNKFKQNKVFTGSDLFLTHFPTENKEPKTQELKFPENIWIRTFRDKK